jgi:hypothetical protein
MTSEEGAEVTRNAFDSPQCDERCSAATLGMRTSGHVLLCRECCQSP